MAFGDEVGEFYHPLSPSSYRLCIDVYGVAAFLAVSKGQETGEIKEPMEMTLSKNGFVIEQNGEKQEILWEQVGSVEHMKGQLIIYMSRIRAYLIPDRAIGDQKEAFFVLLREVIPKERRKRV